MARHVNLEKRNGVAWITIDRPQKKNAMTLDMAQDMAGFLTDAGRDPDCRVIVLRGKGADFSSGGDLEDISRLLAFAPEERRAQTIKTVSETVVPIFEAFTALRQPVIASVRGHVIGVAVQLVLGADLVVASETARFSVPQARLAHTFDHGEFYSLPRKVGMARAAQLALLGETWTAAEAERFSLINWVTPDHELETKTDEIVNCSSSGATIALYGMKALLRELPHRSAKEQLAAERETVGVCAATDDFVEALTAFNEKRKPIYKGR